MISSLFSFVSNGLKGSIRCFSTSLACAFAMRLVSMSMCSLSACALSLPASLMKSSPSLRIALDERFLVRSMWMGRDMRRLYRRLCCLDHCFLSTFFAKKVEPKRVAREKFLRFYPPSKAGKRKLHRNSAECAVSNMRFPLTLDGGESRRNFSMRQLFIIV